MVFSSDACTIDGVPIKTQVFYGFWTTWTASDGNPSSGQIAFYEVVDTGGTVIFGRYVEGDGPLADNNLVGGSVGPPGVQLPWEGTYNTFVKDGSTWTADGTLKIDEAVVEYNGREILEPVFTGLWDAGGVRDLAQLAWFMSTGNAENVSVVLLEDAWPAKTFSGTKDSGAEPSDANFAGTTSATPTPPAVTAQVTMIVAEAEITEVLVSEAAEAAAAAGVDAGRTATHAPAEEADDADAASDLAEKSSDLAKQKPPNDT